MADGGDSAEEVAEADLLRTLADIRALPRVEMMTLLCYEMNGQPLSLEHGAPLRLVMPVKYGIKRIGRIEFIDERPDDYRAKRGYDWYSGH